MALKEHEQKLFNEIKEWERKLYKYEPNDFEMTYQKYVERTFSMLPEDVQKQVFTVLDTWLFHLHALIQGSRVQTDAKERIVSAGRIFNQEIQSIEDMRQLDIHQLNYIAEQQIARHRLYSFAQGGLTGTGGPILLTSDFPAMAVINLRVVQLIAMTYGYEVNTPFEMMTSLKVFHAATLPNRIQQTAWEELIEELEGTKDFYFYEGREELTDLTWFDQPMMQVLKGIAILVFRKKLLQGVPLISMAIGAGTNYQITRKVTEFAQKYYQMRYLKEKMGDNE